MQKSKLIRLFCLLLALIVGAMPSIAGAQTPAMRTSIISFIESNALQDIYCDGTYASYTLPDNYETDNPELCSGVTVTTIPANVVDWILIELRAVPHGGTAGTTAFASAAGSTVIARKAGFLLSNGRIVEAATYTGEDPAACTGLTMNDNCPDVEFSEGDVASAAADNDLYVVVRHRNHLDIISTAPGGVSESDDEAGVYAYDFTVENSGSAPSGNMFVMLGGDTDGNGAISSADNITVVLPNIPASNVYQVGDVTLDGNVASSDNIRAILPNTPTTGRVPR